MQYIKTSLEQILAAASWLGLECDPAPVELVMDGDLLLVQQGDERTAFDADGAKASDEYVAKAQITDRRQTPELMGSIADTETGRPS